MSLFFFEMHTPSKYWTLSLFPSTIFTPTLIVSPGEKSTIFFDETIFFTASLFMSSIFLIVFYFLNIFSKDQVSGDVLYPLIEINASF